MKKIINGKMYNTETAEYIDGYDNIDYCHINSEYDARYWEENLYQKKTGEFFIQNKGCQVAGAYYHEKTIEPLTIDEAKAWIEKHGSTNDYIRLFGEPEE